MKILNFNTRLPCIRIGIRAIIVNATLFWVTACIKSKALRAGRNPKWFDKLTTLSEVEGQIQIPNVLNLDAFAQNDSVLGFLNFDIV